MIYEIIVIPKNKNVLQERFLKYGVEVFEKIFFFLGEFNCLELPGNKAQITGECQCRFPLQTPNIGASFHQQTAVECKSEPTNIMSRSQV